MNRTFDPVHALIRLILQPILGRVKNNDEKSFVLENGGKHTKVQWIHILCIPFIILGLIFTPKENLPMVIATMVGPVMVLGGAWFNISFAAVPTHLLDVAMIITFCMFLAFQVSLTTMFIGLLYVTAPIMWTPFVVIYIAAILSCIWYDTIDGLKVGLDEAQLKFSRMGARYYRREGITDDEEAAE